MAAEVTLKEAHEIKGFVINSYILEEEGLAYHAGGPYGKIAQRVNSTKQVGSPERERVRIHEQVLFGLPVNWEY